MLSLLHPNKLGGGGCFKVTDGNERTSFPSPVILQGQLDVTLCVNSSTLRSAPFVNTRPHGSKKVTNIGDEAVGATAAWMGRENEREESRIQLGSGSALARQLRRCNATTRERRQRTSSNFCSWLSGCLPHTHH